MAVFRVNKNKNYTVISNYHLRDKGLSFKGKGLLSMMLSFPDDWDYSINGLIAISKESKTAIVNTLKELETLGYLKRTRTKDEKGRFEYIYDIFEKPQTENLSTDNHPQINTEETNTDNDKERKKEESQNSKIIVESKNSQNQQVVESTSGGEETNALREQLNALRIENKMLKDKIKERKKEESEKKKTSYDLIIDKFTDNPELKDAIYEFIKMRKLIKKPLTDRALTMILNKLKKLSTDRKIQTEIINQSIMNNWQSIYKLKTDNDWKSKKTGYKPQKFEQEEVTVDEISELRKQLDKEMREKYGEQYLEYKERFNL